MRNFLSFSLISGTGLLISLLIVWVLADMLSVSALPANILGDGFAVFFVYYVSSKRIFNDARGNRVPSKTGLAIWSAWQLFHIGLISVILREMQLAQVHPLGFGAAATVANKALLTPVTLGLNFMAMILISKIPTRGSS